VEGVKRFFSGDYLHCDDKIGTPVDDARVLADRCSAANDIFRADAEGALAEDVIKIVDWNYGDRELR
jgi:hypothetical protein